MYDMYPEWGPAHLDPDHPAHPAKAGRDTPLPTAWSTPLQESLDRRDHGALQPEDS